MSDSFDPITASLADLLAAQERAATAFTKAKLEQAGIAGALVARFGDSVKLALEQAGKTHGSITLPMQDGFALKCEQKQTIKWDSTQLQQVAQTLPWERVNAIFKIAFSVPEAIYKGIAAVAPELREKIDQARTTTIGVPSITLVRAD